MLDAATGRIDTRSGLPPLTRVDAVLRGHGFDRVTLEKARARAETVAAMADEENVGAAAAVYCGEAVAGAALERAWSPGSAADLAAEIADLVGAERQHVTASAFGAAIRSRWLFELPPRLAAETQLNLLAAFSGITEAAIWLVGEPKPLGTVGVDRASRRARQLARETIEARRVSGRTSGQLHGLPVMQWDRAVAALIVRSRVDDRTRALAYAAETALALAPVLEKEALLERNAAREEALVTSSERRLVRLGFDLHDGPLQDIAAMAIEMRLFADQLRRDRLPADRELLAGRVDDLISRLAAIEMESRELARSLEAARHLRSSLEEAVYAEVARITADSRVDISARVSGGTGGLSDSQRIAILRLVESALENVKQHSGAQTASISIESRRGGVRVVITDDGRGFDVETTLVEAARAGRLGLVGMGERIRLLGGRLDISSAPGGPTTIVATLPRWRPDGD